MSPPYLHAHPAWFGSVVSTVGLSLVLRNESYTWNLVWLEWAAAVSLVAATGLAILLLPRYVRRLFNKEELRQEIASPAAGALLATLPLGFLLLGVGWARVGPVMVGDCVALWIDAALLVIGLLVGLGLGARWASDMARAEHGLAGAHGGWLIPGVMNLVVPIAIAPLAVANPAAAPMLLLVGFVFLGTGTFLFLAIFALILARLTVCSPAPAEMAPSLWVPLAPAGILGIATLRLLQAGVLTGIWGEEAVLIGVAIAAMGIGLGMWWALVISMELIRLHRLGGVPFSIGWWSFVFPTAAMALSIGIVGDVTGLLPVKIVGILAALAFLFLWAMVGYRTLKVVLGSRNSGRLVSMES